MVVVVKSVANYQFKDVFYQGPRRNAGVFSQKCREPAVLPTVIVSEYRTTAERVAYVDVDVFVDHSGSVDALDDRSCARVLEDCSGHVQFFVERTDDEVAVQNVIAACVNQSYDTTQPTGTASGRTLVTSL